MSHPCKYTGFLPDFQALRYLFSTEEALGCFTRLIDYSKLFTWVETYPNNMMLSRSANFNLWLPGNGAMYRHILIYSVGGSAPVLTPTHLQDNFHLILPHALACWWWGIVPISTPLFPPLRARCPALHLVAAHLLVHCICTSQGQS